MKKSLLTFLLVAAIYTMQAQCVCISPFYNQTYDSLTTFTYINNGSGNIYLSNGQLYFDNPVSGGYFHRLYDSIPLLANTSQNFTATCKFNPTGGNAPGHMIMMFSELNDDPFTPNGFPALRTFNDALGVGFLSPLTPSSSFCCTNPFDTSNAWGFNVFMKRDTALNMSVWLNHIPVTALNTWFYIMLQRSQGVVSLSVFSDSLFTQHIPGSPMCFADDTLIGPFNFLQQGVFTPGSQYRFITSYVDDVTLCAGTSCTVACPLGVNDVSTASENLFWVENTYDKKITLSINTETVKGNFTLSIFNIAGQKLVEKNYAAGVSKIELQNILPSSGIYFVRLTTSGSLQTKKVLVD